MARAFVVRPFEIKEDSSGRKIDFERVHRDLIKPALEANKLDGDTTGEIIDAGNIREDMFALILEADVVVCDITVHNANVFYEIGIRHALRKRSTILIKGDPTADKTPFDLLTDRYLSYSIEEPARSLAALTAAIKASMASNRPTDSPVFQMVPALPEADPEKVQVVPPDFQEEAMRAAAARSKGWLRLLSRESQSRRFARSGQKIVGHAQWKLKDYAGAVLTYERIRAVSSNDVDANLALANIFERQSREPFRSTEERATLLASSDQAIERVLGNDTATRAQRAEALALKGRNQKTHWREAFAGAADPAARRRGALRRSIIESYESYLAAFQEDLNRFWPGLGAVQMGTIMLDLANESGWNAMFKDNRTARNYREDLEAQLGSLTAAVLLSIQTTIGRLDTKDPDYQWARISEADILFLTSDSDERVTTAYADGFDNASPFDWDAARGQLQLFAELGIKPARVQAAIEQVEKVLGQPPAAPLPTHVVIFAGHQFDEPLRPQPRFPVEKVARASELIKGRMQQFVGPEHQLVLLGSVSPGADILWHEACGELGLKTTVCLPTPAADHARVFEHYDGWRSRYLDIISKQQGRTVLTLSDQPGLPKWLVGTSTNPWARGNEWVINIATSWGADRVTVVAFWDGKDSAPGESGTAHLVTLARNEGNIHIERIDATQLLA